MANSSSSRPPTDGFPETRTAQDAFSDLERALQDRTRHWDGVYRRQQRRQLVVFVCLIMLNTGLFIWAAHDIATALTTDCTCQE